MIPNEGVCQKSSLYLNRFATRLAYPPASLIVHYWGAKPGHYGNTEHSHAFFEICYVADGEGTYENGGVRYSLARGTLYATKPGSRHRIASESGMLLLFVAFEMVKPESEPELVEMIETLSGHPHLFVPSAEETAAVHLWKSLIIQTGDSDKAHPEVIGRMAHSAIYAALLLFHERNGALVADKSKAGPGSSLSLSGAEQYVQTRLSRKLTIKDVANALYVSERQLSRLFSEELGQSFSAWIRTERIRRAAYLLAYTDKSMVEIAGDTGFETVNYFNRVFSQMLDVTPARFRRMTGRNERDDHAVFHRYLSLLVARHQKRG